MAVVVVLVVEFAERPVQLIVVAVVVVVFPGDDDVDDVARIVSVVVVVVVAVHDVAHFLLDDDGRDVAIAVVDDGDVVEARDDGLCAERERYSVAGDDVIVDEHDAVVVVGDAGRSTYCDVVADDELYCLY